MNDTTPTKQNKSRKGLRVALFLVIALVVGAMVVVFAGRFDEDVSFVESPLIGQQAPSLEMEYLDGSGTLATDDLLGEIVVMNFWASWCVPCRAEHPVFLDAARRYDGRGVRFVGVLHEDEPERGIQFLDELGWAENFEYVMGDGTDAAIEYGIYGIPETFVIDANGVIAVKITGVVTPDAIDAAVAKAAQQG